MQPCFISDISIIRVNIALTWIVNGDVIRVRSFRYGHMWSFVGGVSFVGALLLGR